MDLTIVEIVEKKCGSQRPMPVGVLWEFLEPLERRRDGTARQGVEAPKPMKDSDLIQSAPTRL